MKKLLLSALFIIAVLKVQSQIVITEINYNTPGAVDSLDFIEIYNNSGAAVNLTGWKFKKAIKHTIASLTLNPGEYHIFCYDSLAYYRNFATSENQWRSSALSNSGDSLVLENAVGVVIDYVYYLDVSPWPILADGEGPSMTLCNASADNSIGSNWTYGGTPTGIIAAGKEIYANPGAGCPIGDIAPPIPYSAFETSANTIQIYFNEAVNTTASNTANYTGLGSVVSAARNSSNDTVTLTLASALVNGKYYVLTVNNVADLAGNTMTIPRSFNIVFNNTIGTVAMEEIYYDDPFLNDTLEFIEIVNYGTTNIPIGGYWFDKGVKLRLPEKTLVPNEYFVVAKDTHIINVAYGIHATQWSSGGLGNVSEALALKNSLFQLVDSFYYNTATLGSTNGTGASLVICPPYSNLATFNNTLSNWTAEIPRSDNLNAKVVGGQNTVVSVGRYNCDYTGISVDKFSLLNIYPTFTNDVVTIDNSSATSYFLKIYNSLGIVVSSATIDNESKLIDISMYSSGLYYFEISNKAQAKQIYKIIKI